MNRNFESTRVPGVIIIGGAFLGVVGYAASVGLFFAGMAVGLVNAMSPLFEASPDHSRATRRPA